MLVPSPCAVVACRGLPHVVEADARARVLLEKRMGYRTGSGMMLKVGRGRGRCQPSLADESNRRWLIAVFCCCCCWVCAGQELQLGGPQQRCDGSSAAGEGTVCYMVVLLRHCMDNGYQLSSTVPTSAPA